MEKVYCKGTLLKVALVVAVLLVVMGLVACGKKDGEMTSTEVVGSNVSSEKESKSETATPAEIMTDSATSGKHENITWRLDGTTLYLSGKGEISRFMSFLLCTCLCVD